MEPRKLTKEDIDKVRNIEGFPIGKDEDIIALSNPPYYTACPNPFIEDFIKEHGKPYDEKTDDYHREPFASDVSEGKNDPIYNAHTYHTKVPYKAIMRYILHYTNPGDMILDGFCGTGMTGVAACMCGSTDSKLKNEMLSFENNLEWGKRRVVLNDLSPFAAYLSYNYNHSVDVSEFEIIASNILDECDRLCGWMYKTDSENKSNPQITINGSEQLFEINYIAWSDIFICPHCGKEIVFYDTAFNKDTQKVRETFLCPECNSKLKKTDCERAICTALDSKTNEISSTVKQVPVEINYIYDKKKVSKKPSQYDLKIINDIENYKIDTWYPIELMMLKGSMWGDTWRAGYHKGISRVHQFFYKRTLIYLSTLFSLINQHPEIPLLKIWFTSQLLNISKLNRYRPEVSFPYNPLSGTLYISSLNCEANPRIAYAAKIKKIASALKMINNPECIISTNSASEILAPDNSIDYIFTDPPFGDNLMYSELSFIWEAWLKVITNNKEEAIKCNSQGKDTTDYKTLMSKCFNEYYRVLKPNHWITVEFHNSKNSIWNAIQESLQSAGFIIADVRTLDKQQGSYKQVVSTAAVKQDLVISAYKPKISFKESFISKAGSEDSVWEFVKQHLEKLPVVVINNKKIEIIAERQNYLLFDRVVAYHLMNGLSIPINATDFYNGLDERFLKRDEMYFLPDQITEYDTARIKNDIEPVQMELTISNEKGAISWLYQQLKEPQTYAEIQPKFMKESRNCDKYEKIPELSELLQENFITDDEGKWYVPDIMKAGDVAKLREKKLLKEFEDYVAAKGKLKLFRLEAIKAGFAKLWEDKNYKLIVETAERLPESVLQEDDKLLMYYDISRGRLE